MKTSRPPVALRPGCAPAPVEVNGHGQYDQSDSTVGNANGQQHQHGTFAALLEEGQSIQNGLRDLLLRTNKLMLGLKSYRRHAKTMQSTLASLRQLQEVEA